MFDQFLRHGKLIKIIRNKTVKRDIEPESPKNILRSNKREVWCYVIQRGHQTNTIYSPTF